MYFWCFGFRGELGFLNCDDVCMCVVNKQFELLEFVSESVYVDLQYDEISLTFTAGPVCLCGVSSPVVGHVSVFWLRWCGWWRVGRGVGQGSGAVGWCYVCVRCESGFSV